jgi:peptide-methionine (S)-S-oxide reductase
MLPLVAWLCAAGQAMPARAQAPMAAAIFAGGCLWCLQPAYDAIPGVIGTKAGYAGGTKADPNSEDVASGTTGHAEAVEVIYDPSVISYDKLLEIFWRNIDPLTKDAQFCEGGPQHRTAIFYASEEERQSAEASKARVEASDAPKGKVVTQIVPAGPFYAAEDNQQQFYKKNRAQYKFYVLNCGRDAGLERIWGGASATR